MIPKSGMTPRLLDNIRVARDVTFLLRSQWWPADNLKRFQEERLIRIMKHAVSNVPFYRKLGIGLETIHSAGDILRFPVIRKQDIQENEDAFLWPALPKQGLFHSRTSGTTCEPTATYFDRGSWLFSVYGLKIRRVLGTTNPLFKRFLMVNHRTPQELKREDQRRLAGASFLFKRKSLSLFEDVKKHIPFILRYKPGIISSFPSYFLELLNYVEAAQLEIPRIPVIFTASELLTSQARYKIEKGFRGNVYDVYGSTEFKEVAWQCPHLRYHIQWGFLVPSRYFPIRSPAH